jgi:hypothetical protein
MFVNLSLIPFSVNSFFIPPFIEKASLSPPINTGINPDSAIKSDSLSSESQYVK